MWFYSLWLSSMKRIFSIIHKASKLHIVLISKNMGGSTCERCANLHSAVLWRFRNFLLINWFGTWKAIRWTIFDNPLFDFLPSKHGRRRRRFFSSSAWDSMRTIRRYRLVNSYLTQPSPWMPCQCTTPPAYTSDDDCSSCWLFLKEFPIPSPSSTVKSWFREKSPKL